MQWSSSAPPHRGIRHSPWKKKPKGKGSFKKGEWQDQHQQAFEAAKEAIAGAKLLSYLDYSRPIRLRTDACDIGAGAML
jgi:hypothetical protein